jgi:hypothetical protein
MDGSGIPEGLARTPGALEGHDRLYRIIYYGEALRAISEHASETLISGPQEPMLELLGDAYDHLSQVRPGFGPEEFALYVMSLMMGLCDDPDEEQQLRVGAADYIVRSAVKLPAEYCGIVREAEEVLRNHRGPEEDAVRAGARRLLSQQSTRSDAPNTDRRSNRGSKAVSTRRAEDRAAASDQSVPSPVTRRARRKSGRIAAFERVAVAVFLFGWLVLVLAFAFGGLELPASDLSSAGHVFEQQ